MKYQELIVLLPCHSLEDFPLHHEGEDAEGLLANWTALWHPALIEAAGGAPTWRRADDPPQQLEGRLLLVPSVSQNILPTGFVQRAQEQGAMVICRRSSRAEILGAALEPLAVGQAVPDELVADFLALGYCFLQIQLLTRQMRYSSNLDELHFNSQLIAAARAAVAADETTARDKLRACFDVLSQERDHYYSVDAYVLDLTLLAGTTIGPALRAELQGTVPSSVLLSGDVLARLAESEPESLAALREALEEGRISLIGGEFTERRTPLLACETLLSELRRAAAHYQQLLARRVEIYGRHRFGLTPFLPQVLTKLGFRGAVHATLEEGRFPEGSQIKTRWEGADGTCVDAIARAPLDASRSGTFLSYATKLGESMDTDHVATICLAHWPATASPWLDDLKRISRYGSALGKFVHVDEYFRETDSPGQLDRFAADQYRSPYLKQAVIRGARDPISTVVRYWRRHAAATAWQTLATLADLVSGETGSASDLLEQVEQLADEGDSESLDGRLAEALEDICRRFSRCIPRQQGGAEQGYLVLNPCGFVRRLGLELPELAQVPAVEKPVYAADESPLGRHAVVDVPSLGFAWLGPGLELATAGKRRALPALAEELELRNEFLYARINAETGSLQSLHDYQSRGNRLSQQLAFRWPRERGGPGELSEDPDDTAAYSVMAADSVEVTRSDSAVGEIVSRGRLLDRTGKKLGGFRQQYRLWRGSRVLEVEIELEPEVEPRSSPWDSYYACRFAWADEACDLWRTVNETRHRVESSRFEAPNYIEIEDGERRTAILTLGLPFHRRRGLRMLDSLLIVRGERARRFELGIGVDLKHPMHEALGRMTPATRLLENAPPPAPARSSWLIHIDARNVVATSLQPLLESGVAVGLRGRLLETSGRPARAKLSAFRAFQAARQVDFLGQPLGDLPVEEGKIRLELTAHEWIEIEARW